MTIIRSAGGPFVGLSREVAHHWSGVFGKRFVGEMSSFLTDYEAAGALTDGVLAPPTYIAKLSSDSLDAILLSMPFSTAIIDVDQNDAYIV
jgi:hypothetical protein